MKTDLNATITKATKEVADFSDKTSVLRQRAHLNLTFKTFAPKILSLHPDMFPDVFTIDSTASEVVARLGGSDLQLTYEEQPKEAVPAPRQDIMEEMFKAYQRKKNSEKK